MRIFKNSGSSLATLACASMLLASCGGKKDMDFTPPPPAVGSAYIVVGNDFQLPARGDMPAVSGEAMNLEDYLDMSDLDQQCWSKITPYMPSASKEIAAMAGRSAVGSGIGSAIGTGLGAIAAFTGVGFGAYAAYGGLAGLFGGAGGGAAAGFTQHKIAVNFAQYACMTFAVNAMHKQGRLKGVAGVVPWAGTVSPKPMAAPTNNAPHAQNIFHSGNEEAEPAILPH